jgi:hypothetical protein
MRIKLLIAISLSYLCVAIVAQQARVRTISYSSYQPIAERILADDEIVIINREFDSIESEPAEPTVDQFIDDAAQRADIIGVVDVRQVQPILVENGTWIHTRLTGVVQVVLKSAGKSIARGQSMSSEFHGGELRIGTVLVRAAYLMPFPTNREYLIFVNKFDDVGEPNAVVTPMLIENGRFVTSLPSGSLKDKFQGLKTAEVLRRVRRAAKSR